MPDGTATAHLYQPKLVAILREGYTWGKFHKDIVAAMTVAVVALPLSMAIAVASGVSPERGLYSTIVGGFLVSALGGSRFQIGGPAGAFILLVAATGSKFGLSGLLLAVLMSGVLLTLLGASRLGALIRFVPHAVTVGFTCGIAITILASQLKELGGLTLTAAEPGALVPKLILLAAAFGTFNPMAFTVGALSAAVILLIRRARPSWPAMLIAVAGASLAGALLHLPVATIASRFGALPHGLPAPHLPQMNLTLIRQLLPATFSFTLLGGVESLLSAKVADSMSGRKHRSNMELIAQGIANIAASLFGGICITGTIARTATNVRAGAVSPLSGMMHSVFLLLFLLIAAPLAGYVPLASLAGVLVVVCWSMAEKREFIRLLREKANATVLLATFLLTALFDLTTGILTGCALAAFFAIFHHGVAAEGE